MTDDIDLIEYYRKTHDARVYGNTSVKYLRFLRPGIMLLRPASILDYGCGQSVFPGHLNLDYKAELHRYDPAISGYNELPAEKVELLISIDALEHIEEEDELTGAIRLATGVPHLDGTGSSSIQRTVSA